VTSLHVMTDHPCRPDLFRVLSKPCRGSRGDLLVQCSGHETSAECNINPSCIWLRSGWWYELGSDKNNTLFSGEDVDVSVLVQCGVPPSYACWPKWHVPYAVAHWPSIQFKAQSEPLVCTLIAADFPCTLYTNASRHAVKTEQEPDNEGALTTNVPSLTSPRAKLETNTSISDVIGSDSPCTDLVGLKGTCPHATLAADFVARIWKGWEVPHDLFDNVVTNTAILAVYDECGYARAQLVDVFEMYSNRNSSRSTEDAAIVATRHGRSVQVWCGTLACLVVNACLTGVIMHHTHLSTCQSNAGASSTLVWRAVTAIHRQLACAGLRMRA
jgi:hypothetical protein